MLSRPAGPGLLADRVRQSDRQSTAPLTCRFAPAGRHRITAGIPCDRLHAGVVIGAQLVGDRHWQCVRGLDGRIRSQLLADHVRLATLAAPEPRKGLGGAAVILYRFVSLGPRQRQEAVTITMLAPAVQRSSKAAAFGKTERAMRV
jgi:hypothetical protein